jgi:hypothetical protein
MTAVRRPLIGLIALFVGAVTLDRFGLGESGGRTMETYSYCVAAGLVVSPFVFPGLRRARTWVPVTLGLSAYAVVQMLSSPNPGRLDPFTTLTEAAFVALAALLAHRAAAELDRLEHILGTVVFGESPALPLDGPQAANEILSEMARSRRHDRQLSVTVLAPDADSLETAIDTAHEEVQRAMRARYVQGELARRISGQLRRSDLLFEDPETGRFVVLSPETGPDGTSLLVGRIREATRRTRVHLRAGSASFPDQALTFEHLVEHAQELIDDPTPKWVPSREEHVA